MNGVFEFIDTSDFTSMGTNEHFMCTDVEWDPTGRYVITGVSWWGHKVDNAYWIWNFQGKILKKATVDKFCQLTWRPRPPTLLSKEQLKDVKKNLKKYSDQFIAKDKMRLSKASKELVAKRQAMMEDYTSYRLVHYLNCLDFSNCCLISPGLRKPRSLTTSYPRGLSSAAAWTLTTTAARPSRRRQWSSW